MRANRTPRMRWMDNIRHGMNKCGLKEGDNEDRIRWRRMAHNPTWHHSWTKEFYDKDGRRWRRMAQNPDLASQLDKRVL